MSRYGRQIRLADVGESGQARLAAAQVGLASVGFSRVIEKTYLTAAGIGATDAPREETPAGERQPVPAHESAGPELGLRHVAAREVAAGAYAALVAIRRELGIA